MVDLFLHKIAVGAANVFQSASAPRMGQRVPDFTQDCNMFREFLTGPIKHLPITIGKAIQLNIDGRSGLELRELPENIKRTFREFAKLRMQITDISIQLFTQDGESTKLMVV